MSHHKITLTIKTLYEKEKYFFLLNNTNNLKITLTIKTTLINLSEEIHTTIAISKHILEKNVKNMILLK